MTDGEARALRRTTATLLLAAAVRWGVSTRAGPALIPADSAAALPALLDASQKEREEVARRRAPLADGERIDPNLASEVELDRLPGVGPAAARAMVAAREERGGFATPEDLLSVRGIGPATLERMRPYLGFARAYGARALGDPGARGSSTAPIPLNSATRMDLEGLPGVGPALAGRILAERERIGGFAQVEDLLAVRGIGPATLERLRPLVSAP
jgi:competence protein ComEA